MVSSIRVVANRRPAPIDSMLESRGGSFTVMADERGPRAGAAGLMIRTAAEDELDAVGELCIAAYSAGGHLDPGDDYTETLRDARARARSAEVLVAVHDGAIVGTVTICPSGSEFAEIGRAGESEFRFLAVAPAAWRTGVGEALVAACEQRAIEQGASSHVICVIDRNDGAHRFYERLGFHRLPDRDWMPRPDVHLQAYARVVPAAGS